MNRLTPVHRLPLARAILTASLLAACASPSTGPAPSSATPPTETTSAGSDGAPDSTESAESDDSSEPLLSLVEGVLVREAEGWRFVTEDGRSMPAPDDVETLITWERSDSPTQVGDAKPAWAVVRDGDPPAFVEWRCVGCNTNLNAHAREWDYLLVHTEPFVTVTIGGGRASVWGPEIEAREFAVEGPPGGPWRVMSETGEVVGEIALTQERCNDGMSDASFHLSAGTFDLPDVGTHHGCGVRLKPSDPDTQPEPQR